MAPARAGRRLLLKKNSLLVEKEGLTGGSALLE